MTGKGHAVHLQKRRCRMRSPPRHCVCSRTSWRQLQCALVFPDVRSEILSASPTADGNAAHGSKLQQSRKPQFLGRLRPTCAPPKFRCVFTLLRFQFPVSQDVVVLPTIVDEVDSAIIGLLYLSMSFLSQRRLWLHLTNTSQLLHVVGICSRGLRERA